MSDGGKGLRSFERVRKVAFGAMETFGLVGGMVSLCLIIGFFVLTSRVYRILNNLREMNDSAKKIDEALFLIQRQLQTLNDNTGAMKTMQGDLNQAAQWLVDRENAKEPNEV
jgi:hypothetical protein